MNEYTMTNILRDLARDGFNAQFVADGNAMRDSNTSISYLPSEVTLISAHRFEGPSSPGDEAVVFALECKDGVRGTLVAGFGPSMSDADVGVVQAIADHRGDRRNV